MDRALVAAVLMIALASSVRMPAADSSTRNDPRIAASLDAIRLKHSFPALGGAIVTSHGLQAAGVAGVRKAGADVAATVDDLWHLGSDTKAMTAVVIAKLVEQKKLTS